LLREEREGRILSTAQVRSILEAAMVVVGGLAFIKMKNLDLFSVDL